MSIRIDLHFSQTIDIDLLEKGHKIWLIRIMGQVRFKTKDGWSRPYEAIIDTGAPVSLIPLGIWENIEAEVMSDYIIGGIVPNKECSLPVKVGKVACKVIGKEIASREIELNSYLVLTNKVPLIIGFDSFLTTFKLICDHKAKFICLEE